ncbi:MAG TPA: hypothetical protein VIR38_14465 [Thalassobaculum sp.]
MPKRKDFRVIPGGKSSDAAPADPTSLDARQFIDRARLYRRLLSERPDDDTESLVSDLEDAIGAYCGLRQSSEAGARPRAAEYRRLVIELDAEIVAALQASLPF